MTTLHTVNKFGLTSSALDSCLRVALPGDGILLMEDGVYNVLSPAIETLNASAAADKRSPAGQAHTGGEVRVYALKEDLQARGISDDSLPASVEPIAYADFVALVCEHKKSVSWF